MTKDFCWEPSCSTILHAFLRRWIGGKCCAIFISPILFQKNLSAFHSALGNYFLSIKLTFDCIHFP